MLTRWLTAAALAIALGPMGAVAESESAEPPLLVLDPRAANMIQTGELQKLTGAVGPYGVAIAGEGTSCQGWSMLRAPGDAEPVARVAGSDGRFALDAALRAAAKVLDYKKNPAHIVVVATGGSQCISVACSLSQTLAVDAKSLRVDVIGLTPAAIRLRCIAKNTGGTYRTADAGDLPAMMEAALRRPAPAIDVAKAPAGKPPAVVEGAQENEPVSVAAAPTSNIPLPPARPQTPGQADGQARSEAIAVQSEAAGDAGGGLKTLAWLTPPSAEASAPEPVINAEGEAAGVRLRAVAAPGGAPLTSELVFEVLAVEGGAYRFVARSWAAEPVFDLPAGEYVARITHSGVVREHKFTTTGEAAEQFTVSLDLGYITLATTATAGSAPLESDLAYTLRRTDGGAPLVRLDPQPLLALPAGRYEITVASGSASETEIVEVTPGDMVAKTFDLGLGYLRLSTGSGHAKPVQFRIETTEIGSEITSVLAKAEADNGSAPLFRLPAGRHVAIAETEAGAVVQEVVIAPGKLTQIRLDRQTAGIGAAIGRF